MGLEPLNTLNTGRMLNPQALAKRSIDSALMPPPPPPKRIKRPAKVLDEDTYTDALSHIIARDFFPGLVETESQREYLEALDSKDNEWIEIAGRKLHEVMTPGPDGRRFRGRRGTSMTPMIERGGETPKGWAGMTPGSVVSTTSQATAPTPRPPVDTNLSLGAFHKKYTSEDNESFYKLLDKQNLKKAERYNWLWSSKKEITKLAITSTGDDHKDQLKAVLSTTTEDLGKEIVQILSTHNMLRPEDLRPAMPDSWNSRPDNNFMFGPSSIEDELQTVQQKAEEISRAGPKAVVYDNTRLPNPTSTTVDPAVPPSPTISAIRDAIAGRPRLSASEVEFAGGETPRVNGYKFVDSEPSPTPSDMTSTWGDLGSSFLGAGDATPNPFKIRGSSKREALHHRMVDKVAKGKRQEKKFAELRTPVPHFSGSPRVAKGGLTPAAQNLLGRIGGDKPAWAKGSSTPKIFGVKTPTLRSRLGMATSRNLVEVTEGKMGETIRKR